MRKLKKGISFLCLVSLLFVFLCPTSVLAATVTNYEAQQDVDKLLEYSVVNLDRTIDFDEERAIANGESKEIIEMGLQLEQVAAEYYNASQGIATAGVPVWGNWCGPGYSNGDGDQSVEDRLDAACKAHDLCYADNGYFDCDCDQELIDTIDRIMYLLSGAELNMAKVIKAYFIQQMTVSGC